MLVLWDQILAKLDPASSWGLSSLIKKNQNNATHSIYLSFGFLKKNVHEVYGQSEAHPNDSTHGGYA